MHHNVFGKPMTRQLRLSLMEVVLLGAMVLVLALTSVDALEGSQVGRSNALELAKKQGNPDFIAERVTK